jgi:hypothetical protein
MRLILSALLSVALVGAAQAQNFSCPFGKQGACLDYGDKVCSSFAKCVDQNAVCFNSYTCDFRGFVCKSTLDDVTDEYDSLLQKARSLASDYDDLRSRYDEAVDEFDALKDRYDDALRARQVSSDCVQNAADLDEAQQCY